MRRGKSHRVGVGRIYLAAGTENGRREGSRGLEMVNLGVEVR